MRDQILHPEPQSPQTLTRRQPPEANPPAAAAALKPSFSHPAAPAIPAMAASGDIRGHTGTAGRCRPLVGCDTSWPDSGALMERASERVSSSSSTRRFPSLSSSLLLSLFLERACNASAPPLQTSPSMRKKPCHPPNFRVPGTSHQPQTPCNPPNHRHRWTPAFAITDRLTRY